MTNTITTQDRRALDMMVDEILNSFYWSQGGQSKFAQAIKENKWLYQTASEDVLNAIKREKNVGSMTLEEVRTTELASLRGYGPNASSVSYTLGYASKLFKVAQKEKRLDYALTAFKIYEQLGLGQRKSVKNRLGRLMGYFDSFDIPAGEENEVVKEIRRVLK